MGVTSAGRRVWLLKGPKAGDYAQMRSLARALGWPFETRTLAFRRTELAQHLWQRGTLAGLDRSRSDALGAPWPDLVLTAGRRNELVARWIKQQSQGRTRLVHLGRPWSRPDVFDLVIATPQYEVEEGTSLLVNDLPLHDVTPAALAEAAEEWRDELGSMPRPRLAVLVGGDSGPFVFDADLAERMAAAVNAFVRRSHASVWVSTSGRTPRTFSERFFADLDSPAHRYVWHTGSTERNPYRGYLAHADGFIVTSESISMIAEAVGAGQPVWLFDVARRTPRWWLDAASYRFKPLTHRLAQVCAPARFRRDVSRIHRRLVDSGRVAWLDDATVFPSGERRVHASQDLERGVTAVRALFGEPLRS